MRKRKIAFYIESMIVGGAEKVLIDLVNHLDPDIYEVWVIAIFKKSVYSDYEFQFSEQFKPHIHYTFLIDNSNKRRYKIFNFLYNKVNKKWIHQFLVQEKFNIEVAFYEGMPTDFVNNSVQNSHKIAWLHTLQDRIYKDYNSSALEKALIKYSHFNAIIGVSKSVCSSFTRFFPELNPICCYNPIDEHKIIEKSHSKIAFIKKNHVLYFVAVGRLIEIKGFERLIDAFNKIKEKGYFFELNIIGDGELRTRLQDKINALRMHQEIKLLGFQSNPYPYINQSDVLVCSSFQEGLSTVVIEALLLGTPVISTNCGGMDEIILQGKNGFITENTEEDLYKTLLKIFENPSLLESLNKYLEDNSFKFSLQETIGEIEKHLND